MKKHLQKFALSTLAVALLVTFNSCTSIFGGDLTDAKSLEKVKEKIATEIKPDDKIVEIVFGGTKYLNTSIETIIVNYFEANGTEIKAKTIFITGDKESSDGIIGAHIKNKTIEDGMILADIDFSKIPTNIETAKTSLEEEDLNLDGIGSYTIVTNGSKEATTHVFKARSKSGKTSRRGKQILTEYYENAFSIDATGEIISIN